MGDRVFGCGADVAGVGCRSELRFTNFIGFFQKHDSLARGVFPSLVYGIFNNRFQDWRFL
jgi:hypothetical protein